MVDIVEGTNPIGYIHLYDGVILGTNCYQVMRNGFQFELARKYPYVKEFNFKTKYGDAKKLGTVVECKDKDNPLILLCFVTFGYNFKGNDDDFFDYESLEKCLKIINILYKGKHFLTTMIGCSKFDGNANKEKILDIINNEVKDFNLTIYDYNQESNFTLNKREYFKNLKRRYERNKEKRSNMGGEIQKEKGK